jgi:hypothetical protein
MCRHPGRAETAFAAACGETSVAGAPAGPACLDQVGARADRVDPVFFPGQDHQDDGDRGAGQDGGEDQHPGQGCVMTVKVGEQQEPPASAGRRGVEA